MLVTDNIYILCTPSSQNSFKLDFEIVKYSLQPKHVLRNMKTVFIALNVMALNSSFAKKAFEREKHLKGPKNFFAEQAGVN